MKDIRFIGWCTYSGGKAHDKIWGIIKVQGEFVSFWGRRTGKLTFKRVVDYVVGVNDLHTLSEKKRSGGYNPTTFEKIAEMDPEFEDRFDSDLMLTMLGDTYHRVKK